MDLDQEIAASDERLLHVWALEGVGDYSKRGRARGELERRRRQWEEEQAAARREFELQLFNAESERDAKRKKFEEALVGRQMAHATAIAAKQDETAKKVAAATLYAAVAAGLSAMGAVIVAGVELAKYIVGS